jgi:hypothetical protein
MGNSVRISKVYHNPSHKEHLRWFLRIRGAHFRVALPRNVQFRAIISDHCLECAPSSRSLALAIPTHTREVDPPGIIPEFSVAEASCSAPS